VAQFKVSGFAGGLRGSVCFNREWSHSLEDNIKSKTTADPREMSRGRKDGQHAVQYEPIEPGFCSLSFTLGWRYVNCSLISFLPNIVDIFHQFSPGSHTCGGSKRF
jgi:hypothetical protein